MNRRRFLSRAALALGGALLAPLMLARTGSADPADPTATDEYGGGPGVGRARALPRTGGDPTTMDNFIPDDWSDHILAGYEPVGWVKAFDPADIERAFAEPVAAWDFSAWDGQATFDTATVPNGWGPITTATGGVIAWGDTIHFPYIESLTTRPGVVVVNDSHYLLPDGSRVPSLGPVRAQMRTADEWVEGGDS